MGAMPVKQPVAAPRAPAAEPKARLGVAPARAPVRAAPAPAARRVAGKSVGKIGGLKKPAVPVKGK